MLRFISHLYIIIFPEGRIFSDKIISYHSRIISYYSTITPHLFLSFTATEDSSLLFLTPAHQFAILPSDLIFWDFPTNPPHFRANIPHLYPSNILTSLNRNFLERFALILPVYRLRSSSPISTNNNQFSPHLPLLSMHSEYSIVDYGRIRCCSVLNAAC